MRGGGSGDFYAGGRPSVYKRRVKGTLTLFASSPGVNWRNIANNLRKPSGRP